MICVMVFQLDRRSRQPYPAQVQRQALAHVVAGRLQGGDRLPSVRELARQLKVSRTTAERIHEALREAMAVETRPRRGAYLAADAADAPESAAGLARAHAIHVLLKESLLRAQRLGLDAARLGQLLRLLEQEEAGVRPRTLKQIPLVATADGFECMALSLPRGFPVRLVRVPPNASPAALPRHAPYLLCGYYLRAVARRFAEQMGSALLYVRYNTRLLDEFMSIGADEHRFFLTRDADNAETTRSFLASAYPEVPTQQYTVMAVRHWLKEHGDRASASPLWATITAVPLLEGQVSPERIHVHHPTLAEDFVDELRCLALVV
jgi:DNA-binding transcriptional regulator YhcF (GntR family)